jgi:hypothetical protein
MGFPGIPKKPPKSGEPFGLHAQDLLKIVPLHREKSLLRQKWDGGLPLPVIYVIQKD